MSILKDQEHHVLVVSGGASPEHGPLRDTVYASLPPVDEIGKCFCVFHCLLLRVDSTHDFSRLPIGTQTLPQSQSHGIF